MKFFEAVPDELFSPLASPNRVLYADALDVLYTAYREKLKLPEDMLYSMLRSRLEQQLAEATFEGEDIDEDELRDISGRARFLIRKLGSKGWFEKERGTDFRNTLRSRAAAAVCSSCSTRCARTRLHAAIRMCSAPIPRSRSRMSRTTCMTKWLLSTAHMTTRARSSTCCRWCIITSSIISRCRSTAQCRGSARSHFDDFGQKVMEAYIRPLKIKDSVPKYRISIQNVLNDWAENDELLIAMANAALADRRGDTPENCRADLLRKIYWIQECYDNLERDYLDEIDAQVRRYTRAATQKIENLTNRDQNIRGNLHTVLTALSRNRRAADLVDTIQPVFRLYEQTCLSESSLWYRKRPGKRTKAAPVLVQESEADTAAAAKAAALLRSEYGRGAIAAYVQGWLGESDVCRSEDIPLENDKDYVMSLLAVLTGGDRSADFTVQELDGERRENGYAIPELQISRKENNE